MKNTAIKPYTIPGKDMKGSGLEPVGRLEPGSKIGKKEDIAQNAPTHHKRQRSDKETGLPLISKGFLIRADLERKYSVKATLMRVKKYELVNSALLYYYDNVLNKPKSEKLKEAGQEELDI